MSWKFTHCSYCDCSRPFFTLILAVSCFLFSSAQTIFQPSDSPVLPLLNDGQSIEVGVKFKASQSGYITGIRFYKGAGTTGTHIGQLWSGSGVLLASATFTDETTSGWQQVMFNTPYAISAATTYIAACHSSSGDYAVTNAYFTQPVVNGVLRALADGEEGPNGVFTFSSIPMFPVNGFQANNYWVDVVYQEYTGPDTIPPGISSVSPINGAANISLSTTVSATFNEAIDATTINPSTFELHDGSGAPVPAIVSFSPATNTATLTPSGTLLYSSTYKVIIKGGAAGVQDTSGNALASDHIWYFSTVDQPFIPPTEGYGGPILVVSASSNPFSRYTVEMLRAEGLNEFAAVDISAFNTTAIGKYDVMLLGEVPLSQSQVTMISDWVNAGGTLIAFKPSALLTPLLGLSTPNGTLTDKYLRVHTATGPGTGIVNETIQFHGEANLHTLNGATSIATLYSQDGTPTNHPAVSMNNVGVNGGKAIAFSYDLAKSVVYSRQGNPAWAGQKRDGQPGPIRSDDLFFPDWVDFNKIAIPQADEQQRLLANIILQSNLHRMPLPRLWYLPRGLKAAIVMTGDDHGTNGTTGRFDQQLAIGPNSPEDVADWNAIRSTSYIFPNTPISDAQASAYESQGFEIALHPTTQCQDFTETSLESDFTTQLANFGGSFPSLSAPVTSRTHCLAWSDWSSTPTIEWQKGIRLDVTYYYWPDTWVQDRPGMFTGSGMPMRFAGLDGSLIDCYQVTTQMTDESGIDISSFCDQLLDKATGPEGFYGTFCANMHTDSVNHAGANAIIASAMAHKVPVISSRQLLTWLDGRNNTSFSNINWNNGQLAFTVTAPAGARNLNIMLPLYSTSGRLISLSGNGGSNVSFAVETIKGIEYAFFSAATGVTSFVATYQGAPVVTVNPVSQTVCTDGRATFTSAASGNPAPVVQWQESMDGSSWIDINGANNDTLRFVPLITDNNKQFRAVWTNSTGTAISSVATLVVNQTPWLTSSLTPPPVTSGTVFSYTPASNANGTAFTWERNAVAGISNPAANGTGNINEVLIDTTNTPVPVIYAYTLAAGGCNNKQEVVVSVEPSPEGCTMGSYITANFNNSPISAGRYIWFNSVFKPSNIANRTVNFNVTNSRITYTLNNQEVVLVVPDGHVRFSPSVSSPATQFVNGKWETEVPASYGGNVFLTGLSHRVLQSLPRGIRDVKWSMNIEVDKENVTLAWKWTAGVYTQFADHPGLNIKPVDGVLSILSPLLNAANAGTPLNYILNAVPGAMGSGLLSITYTYSSTSTITCNSTDNSLTATGRSVDRSVQPPASQPPAMDALDLQAMPNPSASHFNLMVDGRSNETITLRIVDISGRVINRQITVRAGTTLQLGHQWKSGVYFVQAIQGKERKMIKLIKIN